MANRTSLTDTLAEALAQQHNHRRALKAHVILVNLDELKSVSTLNGRSTADIVLLEVARRLQRFASENDVLSRMGDDEFLLLMKHAPTPEHAFRKAQLMLSSIEETIALAGVIVNLSASVGLCEINPGHRRAEEVLRDVDMAAQMAKRKGGKQCCVFAPAMRDEAFEAHQRKMELKAAVEREEFVLYYQPFVDMRDRSIYGMEALVRWNHPTRGLVQPGTFIPLAEETGQILGIGIWTLREACREFAQLQAKSAAELLLSVNVSPRQLFETPFLKILNEILSETSMPPAQLQLEVTESIFIKDAPSIGAMLHAIRSLGVRIAFDDFGTGYSSLSYLTRYPIDTLKVDQSFVRGMNQGTGGENLVLFMMGLAMEFNMSVTAEGVEEVAHETALLQQGCMYAQGYLYSRPVPLEAMLDLLQHGLKIGKPRRTFDKERTANRPLVASTAAVFRSSNTH